MIMLCWLLTGFLRPVNRTCSSQDERKLTSLIHIYNCFINGLPDETLPLLASIVIIIASVIIITLLLSKNCSRYGWRNEWTTAGEADKIEQKIY